MTLSHLWLLVLFGAMLGVAGAMVVSTRPAQRREREVIELTQRLLVELPSAREDVRRLAGFLQHEIQHRHRQAFEETSAAIRGGPRG